MGLAFSGGGIRSATISLGVAQALVEKDRLLDFDYCSTVSGGGYLGSFLGAMFLPRTARGPEAMAAPASTDALQRQANFVREALASKQNAQEISGPENGKRVRNPVWWLREHSRYLAPDGGSDYFVAAAYMIRNWIAMTYVIALPLALLWLTVVTATALLLNHGGAIAGFIAPTGNAPWKFSVIWLGSAAAAFLALSAGIAYWLTEYMSTRFTSHEERVAWPRIALVLTGLLAMAIAGVLADRVFRHGLIGNPPVTLRFLVGLGTASTVAGGAFAFFTALAVPYQAEGKAVPGEAVIAEARRRFTRISAMFLGVALGLGALALVDTLSMTLFSWLIEHGRRNGPAGALAALLSPVLAWLIHKLPKMLSGRESSIGALLSKWIWTLALIAGLAMLLTLAISIHLLVQAMVFGTEWAAIGKAPIALAEWQMTGTAVHSLAFSFAAILALTLVTGASVGFINLSSLHGLYASRLTRAYLGASNLRRITRSGARRGAGITESDPDDQIPASVYFRQPTAGPLHLVNVTLNETHSRDGSQLLDRDRKGVPLVFAPEGVWIDPARQESGLKDTPISWETMAKAGVEALSLGQLCAISGAAASSAMGSRTTLGGALAFTLANIRLGYWWEVNNLIRGEVTGAKRWFHRLTRPVRTYFYLLNEMRGSYSREYGRLNISDGGHFENSGAYELLRRDVKLVVVCDNGADPDYAFEDLELLIRKARIDLGIRIAVTPSQELQGLVGAQGAGLFFNGSPGDWRTRSTPGSTPQGAFALMLDVRNDDGKVTNRIVWLKPRRFDGLPQDVLGYAAHNPAFPQESTGDQFFDEAQWESYRALGECMMRRLLGETAEGNDILRKLIP
ncbi:patatin-like phospholipase family protein [Novosphingobium sp. 1Y9A]|uniref:Patatin-like phospholipase family protein n=2 Tax=Novosphingobium jiangmenense TaxID=2791981 RepID=A0ABS0HEI9_9SPHN|nr:patatin-like phospholipase family protein [Novosphingobium jiangmenense]